MKDIEQQLAQVAWERGPLDYASRLNPKRRHCAVYFALGYGTGLLTVVALALWEVWSR